MTTAEFRHGRVLASPRRACRRLGLGRRGEAVENCRAPRTRCGSLTEHWHRSSVARRPHRRCKLRAADARRDPQARVAGGPLLQRNGYHRVCRPPEGAAHRIPHSDVAGARPVGVEFGGGVLPPVFTQRNDGAFEITNDFEFAWKSFCPDLDRDRAQEVLARFVLQSDSSFAAMSTAPDRTHPTTYVIAARETEASVAAQEAWAANAENVVRLPADHMLQLSHPDQLVEALAQV